MGLGNEHLHILKSTIHGELERPCDQIVSQPVKVLHQSDPVTQGLYTAIMKPLTEPVASLGKITFSI